MKARVKATGEVIEVAKIEDAMWTDLTTSGVDEKIYYTDDLDFNFNPPRPEAIISGWACRTKRGELVFSDKPPVGKGNVIWHYREGTDVRLLSELELFGNDIFPSLTWQDEPLEVEITIKQKKQ